MSHAVTMDGPEPLGKAFVASIALHGSIVALVLVASFIRGRSPEHWGEPNSMGGVVGVSPVARIPMPARQGPVNPVANDTESQVPLPPPKAKAVERRKEPDADAIPLKSRTKLKPLSDIPASTQHYRPNKQERPNQVYSTTGQALVSPMLGQAGSGGVGVGKGSVLGERFGAYASLLQQLVAQKWNTQDVDPRLHTAPPAIVTFTILRDGTIRNIRLKTTSGNPVLDLSAQRALYDVGKVPELPPAYPRSQADIEFWFELNR